MAERTQHFIAMLFNGFAGGAGTYSLATGMLSGSGWAALFAANLLCALSFLLILLEERLG